MMDLVVRTHGAVRVGTRRAERRIFFGLGRARRTLERSGAEVNSESLARELGVEAEEVESMSARLAARDVSLDAPRVLRDSDGPNLAASLEGNITTPEEQLAEREESWSRQNRFRDALASLSPRERTIIEARHLAEEPPTLAELGDRLGISRERVRQLEARAVATLRSRCGSSVRRRQAIVA
jgi:RNA polymerase sigma-32 factor